jgi:S-(hydroxymethyl)glutathione dehydrogenase / alcohol dehydrogenase
VASPRYWVHPVLESGRINVRDQVSAVWPIDRIKEATTALKAGEVTRAVLDHDR